MIKSFSILCSLLFSFCLHANTNEIIKKEIIYTDGKTELQGQIIYKNSTHLEKAPVIVVIHNWLGITDETILKAHDMANQGYVAFVADIYGKDVRPKDSKEAGATAGLYKNNLDLLRKRVGLAVKEAKKLKSTNIFVAGYCFGGTAAIEYARSGASDVRGVISFHGGLYPSSDDKKIKTELLVLHGAVDPTIKDSELEEFLRSLDKEKIRYDFTSYSGAVHSFTDTTKKNEPKDSASRYDQKADARSWNAFNFFVKDLSK